MINIQRFNKAILIIILLLLSSTQLYAARAVPDEFLSISVLFSSNASTASGFYLRTNSSYYFVTARHVLFESKIDPKTNQRILTTNNAVLTSDPRDLNEVGKNVLTLDLQVLLKNGDIKYDENDDAAVVRIGTVDATGKNIVSLIKGVEGKEASSSGLITTNYTDVKKFDEVKISNDVFIFGYPSSIGIKEIPQVDYTKPLIRKGIIAGTNRQKKTIIIDCPSYYGNSGGPVVELERIDLITTAVHIIGLVSEFVPFSETWANVTNKYSYWTISNSGYSVVVPMDAVLKLIDNK